VVDRLLQVAHLLLQLVERDGRRVAAQLLLELLVPRLELGGARARLRPPRLRRVDAVGDVDALLRRVLLQLVQVGEDGQLLHHAAHLLARLPQLLGDLLVERLDLVQLHFALVQLLA
jgi:hypothetical protein